MSFVAFILLLLFFFNYYFYYYYFLHVLCVPVHFFLSMPLIFTLMAASISPFPHRRYKILMFWISLVFWATELDTSLSSSICQPASIFRYRARGLSLFRGDKVKMVIELDDLSSSMTYRARWPIELGFSREEKKRKNGNSSNNNHMEYKI